jgi:hypothetical protein
MDEGRPETACIMTVTLLDAIASCKSLQDVPLALGKIYDPPAARGALESLGEPWALLIVRDALLAGTTRSSDLHTGTTQWGGSARPGVLDGIGRLVSRR